MEEKNNKSVIWAIIAVVVLIAGGIGIYTLTQNNNEEEQQQATQEQVVQEVQEEVQEEVATDIVALAIRTEALSTLVAAVQAADLVETLQGEGPYTVLAPTNDAFADALAALDLTAEELLAREDLGDILTYHVIPGAVLAADLSNGQVVTTVQGGTLTVEITDAGVFFVDANGGKAQVESADINASNGVVHVIDAVLLP